MSNERVCKSKEKLLSTVNSIFDLKEPIAFIHIPKCAGSSVRALFKELIRDSLILHYNKRLKKQPPKSISYLEARQKIDETGLCLIYGHFNSLRGFGVVDSIPWCKQFVTFLREPFEQYVSAFKYKHKHMEISELAFSKYIAETPPNYLNHFPSVVTLANFKKVIEELFVFIGFYENLSNDIFRLFSELKIPLNSTLPNLNLSRQYSINFQKYKVQFNEKYPLEHMVYEHAKLCWSSEKLR